MSSDVSLIFNESTASSTCDVFVAPIIGEVIFFSSNHAKAIWAGFTPFSFAICIKTSKISKSSDLKNFAANAGSVLKRILSYYPILKFKNYK